jgi:8-oxo-dGTP diphosphatase
VARVVAAALLRDGRLLVARRRRPACLAGRWELPGGKVEPGETDAEALARECAEELGASVHVGAPVGAAVPTSEPGTTLQVLRAALSDVSVRPLEHAELRWIGADELDALDWIPSNRVLIERLRALLGDAGESECGR